MAFLLRGAMALIPTLAAVVSFVSLEAVSDLNVDVAEAELDGGDQRWLPVDR